MLNQTDTMSWHGRIDTSCYTQTLCIKRKNKTEKEKKKNCFLFHLIETKNRKY